MKGIKTMKKRILSILLSVIMLLGMLPAATLSAFAEAPAHDLTITGEEETDYTWSGNKLIINTSGLTVSGTTEKEYIQVSNGVTDMTIENLSVTIPGRAPIEFNGAANLILKGNNVLTSRTTETMYGDDGIKAYGALEISGDGNLTATGGDDGLSAYDELTISASGTIEITGLAFTGIYVKNNTKVIFTDTVNKVIIRGTCSYGAFFFMEKYGVVVSDWLNIKGSTSFDAYEEEINGDVIYGSGIGGVKMVNGSSAKSVMVTKASAPSHNYGAPEFKWDGHEKCTATVTCYCGVFQTKDCTVTSRVRKEATRTEDGERVYTATAEFGGITYTDTQKEIIPKTGTGTLCSKCGKVHANDFWGKIVCFFNRIINWFRNLFK